MEIRKIKAIVDDHKKILDSFDESFLESIQLAINLFRKAIIDDSTIFLCGNGGSAADCQHIAAELVGRFKKNRRPFKAIALTTDSSVLSCISNDFKFEDIFSRQIEALGKKNDLLVSISTSGESLNIIKSIRKANEMGLETLSFLGGKDCKAGKFSKNLIKVPSTSTARIQEVHILIAHIICEFLEDLTL